MPPGFDPVGGWLKWAIGQLFDWLSGSITRQRSGMDGDGVTVAIPISATGYDRQAEEDLARGRIVGFCRAHLMDAYAFGAECDPSGPACKRWDCSELTEHAYRHAGLDYPDGSNFQRAFCRGRRVTVPKPGDPFFFDPDNEGIGHTGIYAGDEMVVEARGGKDGRVRLSPRWDIEAHPRFAGWFRHPEFAYPMEERA